VHSGLGRDTSSAAGGISDAAPSKGTHQHTFPCRPHALSCHCRIISCVQVTMARGKWHLRQLPVTRGASSGACVGLEGSKCSGLVRNQRPVQPRRLIVVCMPNKANRFIIRSQAGLQLASPAKAAQLCAFAMVSNWACLPTLCIRFRVIFYGTLMLLLLCITLLLAWVIPLALEDGPDARTAGARTPATGHKRGPVRSDPV
jgi:hypothetical protein